MKRKENLRPDGGEGVALAKRAEDELKRKVGGLVKMYLASGPPPYQVALIEPNKVIAMGHQEDGKRVDLWQFVLRARADGTTRLILRTRSMLTGGTWSVLHPGIFIMERGMLLGIRKRAEAGIR